MTYDEHEDCDNQLCEAEDKIIALQADNKRLKEEITGLQLYINCNHKGTFANCCPSNCIACIQELRTNTNE